MVTQSDLNKLNALAKAGAPKSYIETVSKIMDANANAAKSKSSGSSSSSKPNILEKQTTAVATTPTTPTPSASPTQSSFFSYEGQAQALGRVADAFKLIGIRAGNALLPGEPFGHIDTASNDLQGKATTFLTNPGFIFGAPAAVATVSTLASLGAGDALFSGSSAAAATPATASTGLFGGLKGLGLAAGAGLIAGSLFGGGGTAQTAPQTVNQTPQQTIVPTQTTTPAQNLYYNFLDQSNKPQTTYNSIIGSPNASINSNPYLGGTTAAANPIQTTSPYQDTTGSQSATADQAQTAGTGISPILLIGAAALFLWARD